MLLFKWKTKVLSAALGFIRTGQKAFVERVTMKKKIIYIRGDNSDHSLHLKTFVFNQNKEISIKKSIIRNKEG